MTDWKRVVYAAECDEFGNCPVCGVDYSECGCPGPTMDEMDYEWRDGELWAREKYNGEEVDEKAGTQDQAGG